MTEDALSSCHHVVEELLLKLFLVRLVVQLYPGWFFNSDIELSACFLEVSVDALCGLLASFSTVADDPLFSLELNWLLDGKFPQDLFIHVNDTIVCDYFGLFKDVCVKSDRATIDVKAPALGGFHLGESLDHIFDGFDPLLWPDLRLHQGLTHAWSSLHTLGHI